MIDEKLILGHLVYNDVYTRKVIPYIKQEYFEHKEHKLLFEVLKDYIVKFASNPTNEVLKTKIEGMSNLSEEQFKSLSSIVGSLECDINTNIDYLVEETEKFCQERAVYNAIMESINIIDNKSKKGTGEIPTILQEALGVSFDSNIGHDYYEQIKERFDFYHHVEQRLPFDLEYFNRITDNGLPKKTLNVILAPTNVGKTAFMCHCAAHHLKVGQNVLYITMEMADVQISKRIDANLLHTNLDDLKNVSFEKFETKLKTIQNKHQGKLVVKEFPTSSAGAGHFRHLLSELRLKKKFIPDIIYIDYLNICCSTKIKLGGSVNSYSYIKSIAEELRALAVENDVPIMTATQSNRDGYGNSDLDLDNISESFGLAATADFVFAIIRTEELDELDQVLIRQLKNRYSDVAACKKFILGVDRAKMKFYDVESSAQRDIIGGPVVDDKPVMDNSKFGQRWKEDSTMKFQTKKAGKKDFSNLKLE